MKGTVAKTRSMATRTSAAYGADATDQEFDQGDRDQEEEEVPDKGERTKKDDQEEDDQDVTSDDDDNTLLGYEPSLLLLKGIR